MSMLRFLYSFLCLLQLNGIVELHDEHDMIVIDTIPKAECINEVLDGEIQYFLSQQNEACQERYWDICIETVYDMYALSCLYKCSMISTPHYIPDEGVAYMQYGHDIIVIKDSINEAMFRKVEGYCRELKMVRKRIPMQCPVACLEIWFSENKIYQIQAEYY